MTNRTISLPKDALPHDTIIEWWYFNGHLADARGKKYSFMDCLFRADIKRVNIPFLKQPLKGMSAIPYGYFAHSVLSDLTGQKNYKEIQNISIASRDSFTRPLFYANYLDPIAIKGFVGNEIAETEPGIFRLKTERLDLRLESLKKPLLEGGAGHIRICGRESYYYSLTDLRVSGMIRPGGEWIKIKGKAWMDHQWADESYKKDKWSWFSVQLGNGTDIMCVEYDDGIKKDYLADLIDRTGRSWHYKKCTLTPGKDIWKSKATKAAFPMSWNIKIPERKIDLAVRSLMGDQEMIFGNINYWEGPTAAAGMMAGKKVKGSGFMELVGYPSDYNALSLMFRGFFKNPANSI